MTRLLVIAEDGALAQSLALRGHAVFPLLLERHRERLADGFHDDDFRAVIDRFRPERIVRAAALPVQSALPVIDPETARALPPGTPPRHVVISGYYGARNTGDNLLLDSIAAAVQQHVPDAHIVVAATQPGEVEVAHGLPAFARPELATAHAVLARTSAFILGGGGLWNDYNFNEHGGVLGFYRGAKASIAGWSQTMLLARICGAEVHVFGMGVGPLHDPGARSLVRFAAENADSIVVRDRASREILQSIDGWRSEVALHPDPVYGVALPTPIPFADPRMPNGYVALNLRDWQFADAEYLEHLRIALNVTCATRGLGVVGVPMQPRDASVLQRFLGTLDPAVATAQLPWAHDVGPLLGALAGSRCTIAMRLHTSLLAHRLRRPAVALAYDPKVSAHFAELGRSDFSVELTASATHLERVLTAALDEHALSPVLVETIEKLERHSQRSLEQLAQRIAATPVRTTPVGLQLPPEPPSVAPVAAPPVSGRGLFGRRTR